MNLKKILITFILLAVAAGSLCAADPVWLTDFAAAKQQAKVEHKRLLLDFTGSDWCGYCIKLDHEVLATEAFATFAKDYILVRLDYPRKKEQPAAEKERNAEFKKQYKIEGFPTLIVTDATGTEQKRAVGYEPGSGPEAYLPQLK